MQWWDEGRRLDLDSAMTLIPDAPEPRPQEAERPGGLTAREIEVPGLIAQGHSDREIGSQLNISSRTIQNHIHHIYGKLGVSSRAGATRRALQHDLA